MTGNDDSRDYRKPACRILGIETETFMTTTSPGSFGGSDDETSGGELSTTY